MLLTADGFSALLRVFGLAPMLFKPIPEMTAASAGDATSNFYVSTSELPAVATANNVQAQSSPQHPSFLNAYGPPQSLTRQRGSSCNVDPYSIREPIDQSFPPFDQAKANIYRYRQQQSVNLGSW